MNERYRAAVLILVLAVLAAFTAMPVLAQTAPAVPGCPLTDGIVLNAQGDAWGLHFLRSDGSAAQARLGPGPGVVPAGRYDVVLAGWDRHEDGDEPQLNEQWFLEGRNGATVAFQSGATPDLADEANLIVSTVNTNVEVPAFSSVVARHAAYPNTESPNSIWPLCASFIPVQPDSGSITVKSVAEGEPTSTWTFDLSDSPSTPVPGDGSGSFTWGELDATTYILTETVLAGWQLNSVSCVSSEEGATTAAVAGGVSVTLVEGEDVTCTFVNSKTTTPTIPPTPSPDPVIIGDRVWEDTNADGYQGDFEAGVAGVTVNLFDSNGFLFATTVTGSAGGYLFSGVPAGTYTVELVMPAGYEFGPATAAGQVSLAAGQSDLTKDFGIFRSPEVLPQIVTTTVPASVTQQTLPFTGASTAGTGGVAVGLILLGGLVLLVGSARLRYEARHR